VGRGGISGVQLIKHTSTPVDDKKQTDNFAIDNHVQARF
jgi:hypothetical protein